MAEHAEIAARLAAATPGPWVQGEMPEWEDYRIVSESVREEWRATAEEGDELVDIFPGTGVMGRTLAQTRLALDA